MRLVHGSLHGLIDRALQAVALTYLRQHDSSNHYKGLLKALLKAALENVSVQVRGPAV